MGGMQAAATILKAGGRALDAVEASLRLVETAPDVHSVGVDAWPNLLGVSELDGSLMDGRTLETGAVGELQGYIHPFSVARQVMRGLPHVMVVGGGAARVAAERDAEGVSDAPGESQSNEVRGGWASWLEERMTPELWESWPAERLAPWARLTADPETAHGTVCIMARDGKGNIASGVSTSGWAWKYPGRLGDSPIIGAGNYCDNRFGAAACTGFGEMAIRTSAARSALLYLKTGMSIAQALDAVATDLHDATWFYRGRVTIYAFDREERPEVLTYTRAGGTSPYWLWTEKMSQPEQQEGAVRVGSPDLL